MWELDHKESWVLKNWCFWTVVLEKTLESPLDCKEIQPVYPKGDQSWVFIGRSDVEAETSILWPPDAKSWLIWNDPHAGKDWGQEEKGLTEDEMAGWHHWLNGHEFGWALGVGVGQGGLACCSSWGRKESWTQLSCWTELNWFPVEAEMRMKCFHLVDISYNNVAHLSLLAPPSPKACGAVNDSCPQERTWGEYWRNQFQTQPTFKKPIANINFPKPFQENNSKQS